MHVLFVVQGDMGMNVHSQFQWLCVAIVSDSVAENCLLYVNQSPDTMTNLQPLLFHRSCSQVRKRTFQLDLLEEVLR